MMRNCIIKKYSLKLSFNVILSTNEIFQQSQNILIYLVVLYDLQSKAFSRSQNVSPTDIFLFIATKISFIHLYDAPSVEMMVVTPYYTLTSTSFMHVCVNSLL